MPEMLYEEVLEVDERVVLYREEPGAGMPVKGTDARVLGRRAAGPDGPLTGQRRASLQAAQGTCWRCSSLWTWGACEGSWRGSCPEASAAWPWCSCTHTRECGLAGGAGGRWASGWAGSSAALGRHRRWAQHEQQVGALARELGFTHVSLSSEAMPMVRIVPRGHTACADAYLTPTIQRYVQGFRRGFQGQLKVRPPRRPAPATPALRRPAPHCPPACPQDVQVLFMRSDGGLAPMDSFSGSRAVLSGPAGGVVGYSATTYRVEGGHPVIGFDMGGMRA